MKKAAVLVLLALASCGKPGPPPDPLDTAEYNDWKVEQIRRRLPMGAGGLRVPGHVDIFPPEQRSKHTNEFVELFLNGERVGKYNVAKLPDGRFPTVAFDLDLNSGPNTFDMWDSSSNKYYRQQVDTRYAVRFTCVPTADGYDIQVVQKKEE